MLPVYDFSKEARSSETEEIDLKGGVCIVEGIHALNPELTSLVPGDQIYRVYAGLREEYCIDGRRTINTQDIRLCRRTLRDAATRGRSPAKTLAMWDRVLDGETRYIKGFKTTADFLLDTSFTYELGLIAKLLQRCASSSRWRAITRSSGTRPPAALSMWPRWRWTCCLPTVCCGNSMPARSAAKPRSDALFCANAKKLLPNLHQTVKVAVDSLQSPFLSAL